MRRRPAPAARRWETSRRPLRIWLLSAPHTTWIGLSMGGADYGALSSALGKSRTRLPVAWKTAGAIAAATPTAPKNRARAAARPIDESAACLRARLRCQPYVFGFSVRL